jgi:hypothetical protein
MNARDLDHIRFITRHYNDLQGLRYWVPLGIITLGWGGTALLRGVSLLAAILLALGAKRFYTNTFGAVEQPPADPASELYPAAVFSPAGLSPRIEGFRQVPPIARHFLITLALALGLFAAFQAVQPNIRVHGDEALGQHPRIVADHSQFLGQPTIKFYPNGRATRPPSMVRAVVTQVTLVLYGSLFLGLWLWRERRPSQSHHLALAILLLGLSTLGTLLGYIARGDGKIDQTIDLLLPALVYPGVALLLCGSSMVLAGLIDHWQLLRAFGRPAATASSREAN